MSSHEEVGSDFVSVVVADGTRIHTQLLADALRNDRSFQVVAAASNSEELLAAIARVPIDLAVMARSGRFLSRPPESVRSACPSPGGRRRRSRNSEGRCGARSGFQRKERSAQPHSRLPLSVPALGK